jgi:hypothetical protein
MHRDKFNLPLPLPTLHRRVLQKFSVADPAKQILSFYETRNVKKKPVVLYGCETWFLTLRE